MCDEWFHRQFTEIQGHSLRIYGINDKASGCTNNSWRDKFLQKECVQALATCHTADLTDPLVALAPVFAVYETCPTSAQKT